MPRLMAMTRNPGATYFIPIGERMVQGGVLQGRRARNAGYWTYPTQSNTAPSNVLSGDRHEQRQLLSINGGYTDPTNYLTPVGAFAGSPGPYGTYDMGGDVWQWNEANIDGSSRGLRGGVGTTQPDGLASSDRGYGDYPTGEDDVIGFRVASVPEPSSITLVVAAHWDSPAYYFIVVGVTRRFRRRRGPAGHSRRARSAPTATT